MSIKCSNLQYFLKQPIKSSSSVTLYEVLSKQFAGHPDELITMIVLCLVEDGAHITLSYLRDQTGLSENQCLQALASLDKKNWIRLGPEDEITINYHRILECAEKISK